MTHSNLELSPFSPRTSRTNHRGRWTSLCYTIALLVAGVTLPLSAQTSVPFGVNGAFEWVNLVKGLSGWLSVGATPVPEDISGNPLTDFGFTAIDVRKNMPFRGPDPIGIDEDESGTYLLSFQGQAQIVPQTEILPGSNGVTVQNQVYTAATNTTTAQIVLQPNYSVLQVFFFNTKATASSAVNTGVTNVKLIRPGYPADTTQIFTSGSLQYLKNAPFKVNRLLGVDGSNSYNTFTDKTVNSVTWAGRVKYTDVHQDGTGPEKSNFQQAHGAAWEYIIQYANEINTDIWINIPVLADDNYVQQLATLFLNGDEYTPGLKPNLHVYVELENEVWNPGSQPQIANSVQAEAAGVSQEEKYIEHSLRNAKTFLNVFSQTGATGRVRPVVLWQYTQQLRIFDELVKWEQANNDKPGKYLYGIGEAPYYQPDDYSSVQSIFDTQYTNSDRTRRDFIGWQAVASYFGIKEVGYESGPSLSVGPSAFAIRDPRMIPSVQHHYLDNWYAVGGDLVNYFAAEDQVNYFGDWLTVEDFEHYDTPTFAGVLGILGSSQPPLTAGQVLPWSVGQTVVLDPSQYVNAPFGADQAPNSSLGFGQGNDVVYLLRSTGAGTFTIAFTAQGSASGTPLNVYLDDTLVGTVTFNTTTSTSTPVTFTAGAGFHGLSLVATSSGNITFPAGDGTIAITRSSGSGTAVVPSAPANLTIVAGEQQAALTWATTASATSYVVARSTTSGGPFTPVATVNSNSYTDTGLTDGTKYYYVTQASNSVGTGANSPQAAVLPGPVSAPATPSAPTVVSAGGDGALFYSPGIAIVSWSPVANATGYNVYKSVNGGAFDLVNQDNKTNGYNNFSGPQSALQWTDRFLDNGQTASYEITAINSHGESAKSASTTTQAILTVRPAPSSLAVNLRDGFNFLTWVPDPLWNPQFGTAFNVKRATQPSGPFNTVIQINSDNVYDYTATPGVTYYYVVTQTNSAGESAPSNVASGASTLTFTPGNCGADTTPFPYPAEPSTNAGCGTPGAGDGGGGTVPGAPSGLSATAGDGQVSLSFSAVSGATSYNVYQGTSPGGEGATPVRTGVSGTSVSVTGLTNGTTYYFTVAAVNSAGTSGLSSEVSATPTAVLGVPAGLSASAGDGQVSLSWSAASGATTYNVYQGTSAGGEGATAVLTGVTSTSTTITGLTNGTTYFFTVKAVNTTGTSAASNEASATPASSGGGGGGGALLAYEPFNVPAGALDSVGDGTGWAGGWTEQTGSTDVPGYNIAAGSALTAGSLATVGNHAVGGFAYQTAGRPLDISSGGGFGSLLNNGLIGAPGNTVWVSALLRKDAATGDPLWISLHPSNIPWATGSSEITLGTQGGGGTQFWSVTVNGTVYPTSTQVVVGQTVELVASITFGSTNTVNLYVNPASGGNAPSSADATGTSTSSIAFRSLSFQAGYGPGSGSLDEIRLGTSFASVTPTN